MVRRSFSLLSARFALLLYTSRYLENGRYINSGLSLYITSHTSRCYPAQQRSISLGPGQKWNNPSIMKEVSIIIVGAGTSGIAAACRLIESGFDNIVILEAEDRIGGRIHTTDFGEGIIDLGAQWVHGEEGNVVYSMASAHNLLGESVNSLFDDSTVFVEPSGRTFLIAQKPDIFMIIQAIEDDSQEFLKTFKGSVGEYFTREFNKRLKDKGIPTEEWPLANCLLEWYEKLENSIDASDSWFETSGPGRLEYWDCEGNLLWSWKKGGYRTVLDLLMRKYPDRSKELPVLSKVIFNKEVENITWDGLECDVKGKVSLRCSDGSTFSADHVIMTTSLGVLKEKAHTMFSPQLPEVKLRSIQGLSIGTVDKMFLKFPHRWWPSHLQGFNLLWTKEARDILVSCKEKRDKSWLEGVFGFYSVDNQPQVLMGWVVGPLAKHMEQLTDSEVIEDLMELLNRYLGKTYNIPQPDEIKRSTWYSNPHFRGSYSCRSLESDRLNTTAAHLAAPLSNSSGKQVLLFAGEATHDHYYSTVHGAIETGWREADRIIELCRPSMYKVAIIGAGISGLAAARTLLKNGINNIIVIEAQDRAGGRILSMPLEGRWVEAGAQWIHGDNSEVWRIARQYNLLSDFISSEGEGLYLREDGVVIESSLVHEVYSVVADILKECESLVEASATERRIPMSIGHHLKQKFLDYLETCHNDSDEVRNMKYELYDWHVRFQVIDNSCTVLEKLSAKAWGKYVFCGGTDYVNFKEGYSSLVQHIVDELPHGVIKYECPIEKIVWKNTLGARDFVKKDSHEVNLNNGGLCANLCNSSNSFISNGTGIRSKDCIRNRSKREEVPVVIECRDGSQISAEHVIVTCSLGHLKENYKTLFSPPLPQAVEKAIKDLGFATINKIYLAYKEPWWNKDTKGFQLIWLKKSMAEPNISEPSSWTRDLTGFDVLPTHKAVLLGWVGGKGAELMEQFSEEEVGEHCSELLKKFTRQNIPKPHTVIRTTWHSNPYIRGGYSHTSTTCDVSQIGPSTLATPVYAQTEGTSIASSYQHPSLLFAGEATHEKYFSTTHGAYESGQRQAEVITTYCHNVAKNKI